MQLSASVLILVATVAMTSAHLCLLSPKQRGSITGLDKAGSDDCILLDAPCGGRPAESPATVIKTGGNFTVIFQKNLDHWVKANPGYFTVDLLQGPIGKELVRIPDAGEPSLHLYTTRLILPEGIPMGPHIIQVTYVPKNSQAPAAFYQCSDVTIM